MTPRTNSTYACSPVFGGKSIAVGAVLCMTDAIIAGMATGTDPVFGANIISKYGGWLMSEKHDIKFKEWEDKKRSKMGTNAFLNKYIKLFKSTNKTNKMLFVIAPILCLLATIRYFVSFIVTQQVGYILIVAFSFLATMSLFVVCVFYFRYVAYEVYDKHILRWQTELVEISSNTDNS